MPSSMRGSVCAIWTVALVIVCASLVHSAADEKSLNFRGYAKNWKGLVGDLSLASTHQVEKRDSTSRCWPGFSPEKNDKMSTCCWYGAQTCCKSSVAGHILTAVAQQLEAVHKNGTSDKCYIAVADLLCLWCSPDTAKFTQGTNFLSVAICPSVCQKLWDSCHDQQATFGIHPPALTPRQLCTALLIEEEDQGQAVTAVIAPESSTECYAGASLSVVENSNCLPHVTKIASPSGPSGGAVAAMVLVPVLVIISTVVAVVVYFRVRKRREGIILLGAGGGGGGDDFSLPADAFGEEGGFLDEEGDISSSSGGLLSEEEDSKFSVQ